MDSFMLKMRTLESLESPIMYLPILHKRELQFFEISVTIYRN
jgi:hypothetical protein